MIKSHDRSLWIGASDTYKVMGNWNTDTWRKWWMQKLGLNQDSFQNAATMAGTWYEHSILDAISPLMRKDLQITLPEYGVRVNYDGDCDGTIYEVKTHINPFKVSKQYWQQAQVEMWAFREQFGIPEQLMIAAYQVDESDYDNFFHEIDRARLELFPVEYDEAFISEYIPKVLQLKEAMLKGVMP